MKLIYIDQNILGYLSEGKILLPKIEGVVWVYSNEHFAEIARSRNLDLLDSLDRIKAQRIRIELDEKYRITDYGKLDNEKSAREYYRDYLESTNMNSGIDLVSLQSFLAGNKDALQVNDYANYFKSTMESLTENIFSHGELNGIKGHFYRLLETTGNLFQSALCDIEKQIEPVHKLRKKLGGQDNSNINNSNGIVIDRIWERMKTGEFNITKDQFFGKEALPMIKAESSKSKFLHIVHCYNALNAVGYWPDKKLSDKRSICGINSDASYVGHAAFCSALFSEDDRLCKKAAAIYQYFEIDTMVVRIRVDN